jgi:hypothetical protein
MKLENSLKPAFMRCKKCKEVLAESTGYCHGCNPIKIDWDSYVEPVIRPKTAGEGAKLLEEYSKITGTGLAWDGHGEPWWKDHNRMTRYSSWYKVLQVVKNGLRELI